jgi:hypothetical protein
MFLIAFAISHNRMRRSVVGALATDPVVHARRPEPARASEPTDWRRQSRTSE